MSDVSLALALAAGGLPSTLCRPCVDCGLVTACCCNYCFAIDRVPTEVWAAGQFTPLCAGCRNRYGKCHYCRGITWVTAPPWTEVKEAAMRAPHGHSSSFTYSSSASSSYGIPADAKACAGLISLRVGTPLRLSRNLDTPRGFVNGALCELGTSSSSSNAYGARIEFQRRGAGHDHAAMW